MVALVLGGRALDLGAVLQRADLGRILSVDLVLAGVDLGQALEALVVGVR